MKNNYYLVELKQYFRYESFNLVSNLYLDKICVCVQSAACFEFDLVLVVDESTSENLIALNCHWLIPKLMPVVAIVIDKSSS